MKNILLITIILLSGCSYPRYLISQAKNDIQKSQTLDSIETQKDTTTNTIHINNKKLFASITIAGGLLIGICEIINIENPSNGLSYTISIALPITLISA
jgi:uncharacterized membrane protein SpoIIM required for sporulation